MVILMRGIDSYVIPRWRYTSHSKARDNCTPQPSRRVLFIAEWKHDNNVQSAVHGKRTRNVHGALPLLLVELFTARENYNVLALIKEFTMCKEIL